MAATISYDIKGHQAVKNSLRKLASEYREETDSIIEQWAKERKVQLKAFGYPAQKKAKQPFKTDKQRRWFFWALNNGMISVPYQRTGRLANSWGISRVGWSDYAVRNSAPYSAIVIGKSTQSKYHLGHWWVAQDIIDANKPELTKDLTEKLVGLTK
jgi:hypothetical protein